MTGRSRVLAMRHVGGVSPVLVRRDLFLTRTLSSHGPGQPREKRPEEVALGLYHRLTALGATLGHSIRQRASSTAKTWWDRYEEFVGLNEVREAQGNVTEVRTGTGVWPCPLTWAVWPGGSCQINDQPQVLGGHVQIGLSLNTYH